MSARQTALPGALAIGLLAGVVAAVLTGHWWLIGVGLVLGAGIGAATRGRSG